jgi:PmbA protein
MSRRDGTLTRRELAAWVLARAKAAGAKDCRVKVSGRRFVSVSYRERRPELVSEAGTRGLSLEVYADGHYAAQETPDFRAISLEGFVSDTVDRAKITEEDPFRSLPDLDRNGIRAGLDLGLADPGHAGVSIGERHRFAKDVEESCLDLGGDKVISVEVSVYDHDYEEWVLDSKGFEGTLRGTEFWASAQMSVRDQGDRRPSVWTIGGARHRRDMPAAGEIGAQVSLRANRALGAGKIGTEVLPIVIENRCVGRLLGGFLGAMSGKSVQQKQSFLIGKKGLKIGSPAFTLTDDPFIPRAFGSRLYDGDGFPAKRREMLSKGVLNDYFIDWYYSRKLGIEPTTGSLSNLVLPAGTRRLEDIIRGKAKCVLVTDFIGGNSNATTGDFSVGIAGTLYEKGVPVQAVAEMNIAGNHLHFWDGLVEAGDDPWLYGAVRSPSLVFDGVVVSGK